MRTTRIALAAAALLSLTACAGSPAPVTVRGSVTDLYICCTGTDPYAAVAAGDRVQILAPDGKVIGSAVLGRSPLRNGDGGRSGAAQDLPFRAVVPREDWYMVRIRGFGIVSSYGNGPDTWKPGQRILVDLGV